MHESVHHGSRGGLVFTMIDKQGHANFGRELASSLFSFVQGSYHSTSKRCWEGRCESCCRPRGDQPESVCMLQSNVKRNTDLRSMVRKRNDHHKKLGVCRKNEAAGAESQGQPTRRHSEA